MDGVAVNALYLVHNDGTHHTIEDNLPIFIRIVQAIRADLPIRVRQEAAVGCGNFECHALQRGLLICGAALIDNETAGFGILKCQAVGRTLLDPDGFGRGVLHIAIGGLFLRDNEDLPRL